MNSDIDDKISPPAATQRLAWLCILGLFYEYWDRLTEEEQEMVVDAHAHGRFGWRGCGKIFRLFTEVVGPPCDHFRLEVSDEQ